MGRENAEGMAHVGDRVEPPVGSEGTVLHLYFAFTQHRFTDRMHIGYSTTTV